MERTRLHQQTPAGPSGKGSRRLRTLLIAASAAVALGAWSPGASAQDPSPARASSTAAAFPLTLTDDEGTSVTLPAAPGRVISLSPANTEIVFALGAGDLLMGGTDFDDYPAEAAALPDVATFNGVLLEQVVALEPDLVLAAGVDFTHEADIERMRELGYPVVVVYAETVDGVLGDIKLIGRALGRDAAAAALIDDMQTRLGAVAEAAALLPDRPRTFYQIGWSETQLFGPPPNSVFAELVALAAAVPITTGVPDVYSMSLEALVQADPEVILLGDAQYGVCPADVIARPGWGSMTAVVKGAVRPVNDTVVTRPGPRLPEGLASVARAIHPELELPGFEPDPPMCGATP